MLVDQHWTWREDQAMARRLKKSKLDAELNRPFMIGICQGQTELSSPLLPTEALCSSRFLIGRALYRLIGSVFVFVQFVFRPRVFASSWVNGQA